jgi:Kef-type K+ transport system membrane component KefB
VRPATTTAADLKEDEEHEEHEELEEHKRDEKPYRMQQIGRAALIVLQSMLAVAFGAGLFIGFDQLWKWNNIVALVLSVLVILGLVVGVRIVRKTEDITSTLIAVAVGALVTLGPLALLQSG